VPEPSQAKARRLYSAALRLARLAKDDYGPAAKLLQEASKLGCPDADFALATWYLFGRHFAKNVKKGNHLLRRAAKAGNRDACYNLAISYDNGFDAPEDRQRAFELYSEAAMRGHIDAHKQVARCLWDGSGVKKNRVLADLWGEKYEQLKEKSSKTRKNPKPVNKDG
jgi:TPR repeat protein